MNISSFLTSRGFYFRNLHAGQTLEATASVGSTGGGAGGARGASFFSPFFGFGPMQSPGPLVVYGEKFAPSAPPSFPPSGQRRNDRGRSTAIFPALSSPARPSGAPVLNSVGPNRKLEQRTSSPCGPGPCALQFRGCVVEVPGGRTSKTKVLRS